MTSVVEFVMPVDTLRWGVVFNIVKQPRYSGSGSLLVENITRSETLLDESSSETMFFLLETTIDGRAGDLIRVSIAASASGAVAPGVVSSGGFDMGVRQLFIVPEPASLSLLGLGAFFVFKRRRQIKCEPLEAFAL